MKLDGLQRRSRFAKPQPLEAKIVLTERDLAIFEAIDRHGKLPTNYLFELTKHLGKDYVFLQKRLTQLYNGVCEHPEHRKAGFETKVAHVCHPKHYLTRDWQQFNNFQARYQPAVYGLAPLARKVLSETRGERLSLERTDPFIHQFMGACFSASLELLCKKHKLRFITREEILAHPRCPQETRNLRNPFSIPVADQDIRHIVPDNLFGLEYPEGGFRFFAVEIDRNTETINPTRPVKNSIAKKVKGYTDILLHGTHTSHFGLPNLTVLFVTTNDAHMRKMIEHTASSTKAHRFLFKSFPTFGEVWRVPREILPVFDPWASTSGLKDISKKASA